MSFTKFMIMILCLGLFYSNAAADSDDKSKKFGIALCYGEDKSDIDIYRAGFQQDYGVEWFKRKNSYLSGFFELSYNHWKYDSDNIQGIALSPVFAYYMQAAEEFFRPYIAGGIGVAYIDRYQIRDRNLGSNFQFEDRIGIGAIIGSFDISLSYFHYSNAGIQFPNDGIDIWLCSGAFRF